MASQAMAAMLDELMGRNRNVAPDDKIRQRHWSDDPDVCRLYIVDFCPHELFTNTKADLGPCGKVHDEHMRTMYEEEKEDSYRKQQCSDEFLRFCQRMLTDLQSRIRKSRERLALTQNPDALPPTATEDQRNAHELMNKLTDRIAQLVDEAEACGNGGEVEEAQGKFDECEKLRSEREELRNLVRPGFLQDNDFIMQQQQKAMEVCDICGAFLIVGDAQQRVDDHLMGKQHVGYARLRVAVDRIVEAKRKLREEREQEREKRREAPRESRDKDKEPRESRDAAKPSSNGAEKEGTSRSKNRSRSRSRSRSERRGRSRSKERRRRSRSRSRERRREKKAERSKRSRSRERTRRSRSRDRDRGERRERKRRSRSRSKDKKH